MKINTGYELIHPSIVIILDTNPTMPILGDMENVRSETGMIICLGNVMRVNAFADVVVNNVAVASETRGTIMLFIKYL
jgi:hypothetical protein